MAIRESRTVRISLGRFNPRDPIAIGCTACAYLGQCGGMSAGGTVYDCRSLCCGSPNTCKHAVCPEKKREMVIRSIEVGGFGLENINIGKTSTPALPNYIPLVDTPASRSESLDYGAFVIPITASIRKGRFRSRQELCDHFLIKPESTLIFNGVGQDRHIEPLWPWFNSSQFADTVSVLKPDAIWTPNFSLFSDAPRTQDLHSIKRIAICTERIAACGIAPILHLNARTPHDYKRWGDLLSRSPVDLVAFEFHSMPKRQIDFHLDQLCHLQSITKRPLTILARGISSPLVLERLARVFSRVVFVDTHAIQASRRRYYIIERGRGLERRKGYALNDEPVDRFAQANVDQLARFYGRRLGPRKYPPSDGRKESVPVSHQV